jgi:hypothetical protein
VNISHLPVSALYLIHLDLITLQPRCDFMTLPALPPALSIDSLDKALTDIDAKGVRLETAFPDR